MTPKLAQYNLEYPLTELCKIALRHGSDRCPRLGHCYTPFYDQIFKDKRQSVKKVLEMGVGLTSYRKKNPYYVVGAGLRMWRDYFPNAQIFGADIVPESLFAEDRLTTYLCDERNEKDVKHLISLTGNDIDIVIDDASHHIHDQMFLLKTLMPLLNKSVTYIVEDCWRRRMIRNAFPQYNCFMPAPLPNKGLEHDGLVIFTYK